MASNILDTVSLTVKLAAMQAFEKTYVLQRTMNVQREPVYDLAFYKMKKIFVFKGKCVTKTHQT